MTVKIPKMSATVCFRATLMRSSPSAESPASGRRIVPRSSGWVPAVAATFRHISPWHFGWCVRSAHAWIPRETRPAPIRIRYPLPSDTWPPIPVPSFDQARAWHSSCTPATSSANGERRAIVLRRSERQRPAVRSFALRRCQARWHVFSYTGAALKWSAACWRRMAFVCKPVPHGPLQGAERCDSIS